MRDENCNFTDEEMSKLDLSVFDESDGQQMQEKLLVGFGCLFGVRGGQEHVQLTLNQIGNCRFPSSH